MLLPVTTTIVLPAAASAVMPVMPGPGYAAWLTNGIIGYHPPRLHLNVTDRRMDNFIQFVCLSPAVAFRLSVPYRPR